MTLAISDLTLPQDSVWDAGIWEASMVDKTLQNVLPPSCSVNTERPLPSEGVSEGLYTI